MPAIRASLTLLVKLTFAVVVYHDDDDNDNNNNDHICICICIAVRKASRRLTARYDEALAPVGINLAQFSLLRNIRRHGPVSLTRLGELTELDRSSNRLAIGLVMSSLIVASALVIRSGSTAAWWISVPTFILSSMLGVWLIYGVFRSGRL